MTNEMKNWPDLAVGLYDRLTERNAEIHYDFQDMELEIPSGTGENVQHATWKVSGGLVIHTRDRSGSPN